MKQETSFPAPDAARPVCRACLRAGQRTVADVAAADPAEERERLAAWLDFVDEHGAGWPGRSASN